MNPEFPASLRGATATKQSMLPRVRRDGLLPPSLIELRRTSRGACHRAALRADPLARNDGGWNALLHHTDFVEIFQHAGMDQLYVRRGANRVRRRRLAGLRKLLAECRFDGVQRAREAIGDVIGQILPHQDETPGAHGIDWRGL